jgi:hypothetical protein
MAANVHGEPFVASKIEGHYVKGTVLELVTRKNGWAEVRDPRSKEMGWILERPYLARADASAPVETVASVEEPETAPKPEKKPSAIAHKAKVTPRRNAPPPTRETVSAPRNGFGWRSDQRGERREARWARRAWRRGGGFFMLAPPF